MKRSHLLTVLVLIGVLAMPYVASASTVAFRQEYLLGARERVSGNLLVGSSTVSIGGTVSGDAIVAGGTVAITGPVFGDVLTTGGTILISGPVSGDVRVVGGQITLGGPVSGDVVVAGGNVHLLPNAQIGGNIISAAGMVALDGDVRGSVTIRSGKALLNGSIGGNVDAKTDEAIVLGDHAVIGGDFKYSSSKEAQITSGAVIRGETIFTQAKGQIRGKFGNGILWGLIGVITAFGMLMAFGAVLVAVWLWRRPITDFCQHTYNNWWPSVGHGIVWGIITPVVVILLLVSIVGFIPGVLLAMAYGMSIAITKVISFMFVGAIVAMVIQRNSSTLRVSWWNAILGVILLSIVGMIPLIGWIASIIIFLGVFGSFVQRVRSAVSLIR